MPNAAPRTNRWFEPQTLVGIIGLLGIGYTSYRDFQSDMGDRVNNLTVRIAVLETQVAYLARER